MQLSKTTKNIDFENCFKEYYSPLCKYAYTLLPDQDLCEDLVQEIFLKIWDKNPDINSSLSSYLYRAVKNACINEVKKKMQQANLPIEEIEDPMDTPFDLNREKNLSAIKVKVTKAIDNLPPRCREIFVMRRNMQMSYDEISIALNISKKTIENQMNSAIKKLRTQLSKSDLLVYFLMFRRKQN
ncbi:RNA polymerase sigma-70 factor [Marinifilum caeruleilacunae]|jgi:RNA polymerase sigma-70 factor (ECF subfamily)|uniref:RNA polymerase sigma-70 factor n=1 Tax=Marinifilum caeruleilacunae TaxID=2499076 RepID=A0ABX1WX81_9BACT|nr:RNA polymerase sigma-70 factor [Marinifilum caeruleilacunae]NOU60738.1 RNA polymerase sigma-70 factor [Marinifilum caeruleilacunae]